VEYITPKEEENEDISKSEVLDATNWDT